MAGKRPSMTENGRAVDNDSEKVMLNALADIMQRAWDQLPQSRPHMAVLLGELLHLHEQLTKNNDVQSALLATCGPHFMKAPRRLSNMNTVRRRASLANAGNRKSATMRTASLLAPSSNRPRSRAQSHYTPETDAYQRSNTPITGATSQEQWSPQRRQSLSPLRAGSSLDMPPPPTRMTAQLAAQRVLELLGEQDSEVSLNEKPL